MAARRSTLITLACTAALVLAGCGGGGGGGGATPAAAAVRLEPAASPGADPFTASVSIGPAVDFPGNIRAISATLRKGLASDAKTKTLLATGTTPGLFGGSGDKHVCDPQKLVGFLGQHPDKAAAWAGVLGIRTDGIAQYVATLTPVVLTGDTRVTNHGYRAGAATSLQSVLQAGTAVMVDSTGVPRVKCNCGNPLAAPEPIALTNPKGTAWAGYTPTAVTTIRPGPLTKNLTLLNTQTGDTYTQPIGTGQSDGTGVSDIDFRNYTYQDRFCQTNKPVRLTNGLWRQDPTSPINVCGMQYTAVELVDVTGDGNDDAIVTGSGNVGGTALSQGSWTTVFTDSPSGPVNLGYFDGEAFPGASASGGFTVWLRKLGPKDPTCCPSSYQKTTYKFASTGRFTVVADAVVPASELPTRTPTSEPPTSSLPTASPPCTIPAVQAAITTGTVHHDPKCVGIWAVAFPTDSDRNDFTVLLKWNGSAWKVDASAAADCNSSLPAPIYPDCFSN